MTMHYQNQTLLFQEQGELYIGLASDILDPENITPEEEAKLVNIGAIESGANIDITNEFYQ